MPRLKNRNKGIPHDFQILHPEAGMTKPFKWPSFTGCVEFEFKFRKGNPALCKKYEWTLDRNEIETYVENQQVQRLLAGGFTDFLMMEGGPPKRRGQHALPGVLAAVAGHLNKLGAGKDLIVQWLGDGLMPVSVAIAIDRASVCVKCPKNQEGNLWQRLTSKAAKQLTTLVNIKNDLKLKTPHDDKLKVCVACDCWLPLKVHTPIEHIEANTSEDVWQSLDKGCWLFTETGRTP